MVTNTVHRKTLTEILQNEDAFATSLLAISLDTYGTDIFEWDPRTLWMNLAEDFGANLPPVNRDKIQALILAYTTDLFHVSVECFTHLCNVLGGSEANFRRWDKVTPEEIIWGVYEVSLNTAIDREPGEDPPEFSHEVRIYIGATLQEDGIFDPPDILRIAEMPPGPNEAEWSDEPDMFNASFDKAQTEKKELMVFLANRLSQFMVEINSLPLQHKDTETWDKFRKAVESNIPRILREIEEADASRS